MTQPHWPTFITILAVLGLDAALPSTLRLGPQWLFSSIAFALAMAHFVSYAAKRPRLSTILEFAVDGLLALQLVLSLILLIRALPAHKQTPQALLFSAACLWVTNILVFALWYWRLDAEKFGQRDHREGYTDSAFRFDNFFLVC